MSTRLRSSHLLALLVAIGCLSIVLVATSPAMADDSPAKPPGARCCVASAYFPAPVNGSIIYGGLNASGISQQETWS